MGSGKRKRSKAPARPTRTKAAGIDYSGASKSTCATGKWGFPAKSGAKTLVKALRHQGDQGVRTYRCPDCGWWHAGHMPVVVRTGEMGAGEVYGDR